MAELLEDGGLNKKESLVHAAKVKPVANPSPDPLLDEKVTSAGLLLETTAIAVAEPSAIMPSASTLVFDELAAAIKSLVANW